MLCLKRRHRYAGKIMAALDRQDPRDLFDIAQLLDNEGIPQEMRTAFIVYLISHDKSPHSFLNPKLKDISSEYEQNFVGMTLTDVSIETLTNARENLIHDILCNMPDDHKDFLHSFYSRKPAWALLGIDGVDTLPAVRWRELNLDKAGEGTCTELLRKLEEAMSK